MELIISEPAHADLLEIAEFLALHNVAAAERQLRVFKAAFLRLVQFPQMGKEHNDLLIGLHVSPVGKHLILYQIHEDVLEIVRVRHGSTDIDNLFENL